MIDISKLRHFESAVTSGLTPARSNTNGLRVYFEASGVDYFIPAEVEQMINSLDQPEFYELEELDRCTWGVLIVTASASYRVHAAIKEGL